MFSLITVCCTWPLFIILLGCLLVIVSVIALIN